MTSSDPIHVYDLEDPDRLGGGMAGAALLHLLLAGAIIAVAYLGHNADRWGENQSSVGAIQASMVSAIPLPSHAKPVEKQVLASEDENQAPLPPPREATQPPPKPTDILIKAKTPPPAKPAPVRTETPAKPQPAPPTTSSTLKHPQPTPPTTKAETGETTATQLPEAISQLKNGTATISTPDRTFGFRYAYYLRIVSQKVSQNWVSSEADPRTSTGKRATVYFDIDRDGTPQNIRIAMRSGSPSLDESALRAVQRVDGFGPLPAGNQISIEFAFDYGKQ